MKTKRRNKAEEYQDRLTNRLRTPYRPEISFCPNCGNFLKDDESFVVEYWSADKNVFYIWCNTCDWKGEVVRVDQMIATEMDE